MPDELLADDEVAVLELADRGLQGGALANAIRGLGYPHDVAYYRKLNWLLDTPKAVRQYPVLVNRLRRIRESRTAAWRL